ncbi:hypothetical protein ACFW3D_32700 [Streptomyces sp. NPDC058864]
MARDADIDADITEARATGPGHAELDLTGLEHAPRDRVDGEVRLDAGSRGAYATDGSNRRDGHLAEALAFDLDGPVPGGRPERLAERPDAPLRYGALLSAAGGLASAAALVTAVVLRHRQR